MRNSVFVVLLALVGVAATAPAKTKKEAGLSKLFCQARYAYVETYEGVPDARIAQEYPVDYDAAVGVQERLQKWNRYTLANEEQQADLVFVVWKARPEGNRLPGQPTQMPPIHPQQIPDPGTGAGQNPGSPQGMPGQGPGGMGGPDGGGISHGGPGVGVYPVNDQLAVYQPQSDENLQTPIWKKSEKDGLKEPRMTLFGELADAVDDACSSSTGSSK
ncbi:MAG TPA: hypothetical protein VMD92_13370 [Acidobacteriaceae bacterium]|nr:hypothetical protein [Acidobacteriaceae bacterium]